ncbi:MAG: MHYT domain-containing protein [Pseudomonadota bacterium]
MQYPSVKDGKARESAWLAEVMVALDVSYDPALVFASVVVAIMAAFMGLRLTSGIGALDTARRKPRIAMAAIALGGGIWSMHFIAMLAIALPVDIGYAALPTLGSVLIAILVTGLSLVLLHFRERTTGTIVLAGILMGLGIVSMHYVGMSAITGCIVSYRPAGFIVSTAIGIAASTAALQLAYKERSLKTAFLGSIVLGLAVAAMHYSAMAYTLFLPADGLPVALSPMMTTGTLALLVALAAFVICGLFILVALPDSAKAMNRQAAPVAVAANAAPGPSIEPELASAQPANGQAAVGEPVRIPYERDNATRFVAAEDIAAIKADGHYSQIINRTGELFCPWPISRVANTLDLPSFIQTHRSYLVNIRHVSGFKQTGDKAVCVIDDGAETAIPVSRSRVSSVRAALGLARP